MSANLTHEMSAEEIQIFEEFMKWRAENHPIHINHRRMEISKMEKLVEESFLQMAKFNNYQGDYISFVCGIGLGMKFIMGDVRDEC